MASVGIRGKESFQCLFKNEKKKIHAPKCYGFPRMTTQGHQSSNQDPKLTNTTVKSRIIMREAVGKPLLSYVNEIQYQNTVMILGNERRG
jgi:hypothetical protein